MKNRILILSPGPACWRTKKIVKRLEHYFNSNNITVKFEIETDLERIKEYNTWLLPTILINGVMVSRGYFPPEKVIEKHLTTERCTMRAEVYRKVKFHGATQCKEKKT